MCASIDRLEQLGIGLGKELALWPDDNRLLSPKETVAYREAIPTAWSALDNALMTLAKAYWGLEEKNQDTPPPG